MKAANERRVVLLAEVDHLLAKARDLQPIGLDQLLLIRLRERLDDADR